MHSIFIRTCQRVPTLPKPAAPALPLVPVSWCALPHLCFHLTYTLAFLLNMLDQTSGHIRPHYGSFQKATRSHYTSPLKPCARKNQQIAREFGTAAQLQALHTQMASHKNPAALPEPSEPDLASSSMADPHEDVAMLDWVDEPPEIPEIPTPLFLPPTLVPLPGSGAQNKARRQCAAWDLLLLKLA
ncbi:hypothetical protein B0H14DRAFT_3466575 [Mycena olivaceomarginata]|nr:hypothetical protein B0H14DRAFT_3466575 [Mycena olivaceomarginata]